MEFLFNLGNTKPQIMEINGIKYCDKKLIEIPRGEKCLPDVTCLMFKTLSGFADYCSSPDITVLHKTMLANKLIIHIGSGRSVSLTTCFDSDRGSRETLAKSEFAYSESQSKFNNYLDQELFVIWMLTNFASSEERSRLLSFVGNIRDETIGTSEDDGVTQIASVKRGARLTTEGFKNPIMLNPFRTFSEIEQPSSNYILRLQPENKIGLFSVEDRQWELEAIKNISNYLKKYKLPIPIMA